MQDQQEMDLLLAFRAISEQEREMIKLLTQRCANPLGNNAYVTITFQDKDG